MPSSGSEPHGDKSLGQCALQDLYIWGSSILWQLYASPKPCTTACTGAGNKEHVVWNRLTSWVSPRAHVPQPCVSEGFCDPSEMCIEGRKTPWYVIGSRTIAAHSDQPWHLYPSLCNCQQLVFLITLPNSGLPSMAPCGDEFCRRMGTHESCLLFFFMAV